ncbi:helix-turn-helix transcriptional regulator [Streptomyces sp. NPDC001914]|uniref:helix-turn-helix transcriptional regulator n=1 Tax=Streptomyces sp. NPDC001914 TaxID=3364623 RepID=UPI0036C557E6
MRTPLDPTRLKRRRIERGLSQTALAHQAGVSKQLVCMVEKGTANFSPANLSKITDVLGCDVDDLVPVNEARTRVHQLMSLVTEGDVTFGPGSLGKMAELLGCEVADLSPEDLKAIAEALDCEVADLLPADDAAELTGRPA